MKKYAARVAGVLVALLVAHGLLIAADDPVDALYEQAESMGWKRPEIELLSIRTETTGFARTSEARFRIKNEGSPHRFLVVSANKPFHFFDWNLVELRTE